jgi:hypothetical protein
VRILQAITKSLLTLFPLSNYVLQGPDGTTGFAPGWTQRVSEHAVGLSGAAKEFVPSFQEGNVTQEDTKSVD